MKHLVWGRKIVACLLSMVMMLTMTMPAWQVYADTKHNTESFEVYQANFLYRDPGVRNDLSANMLHRILYEAIKEEAGSVYETATTVQTFLNSRNFRLDGMAGLYEQVLLDILQVQMIGGDANRQAQSAKEWRDDLWEMIGTGLDWGAEIADNGAIRASLQGVVPRLTNVIDKGFKKSGFNFTSKEVSTMMKGANLLIGIGLDVVELVDKLALYMSLQEYMDGTIGLLRIMYRDASDPELQTAIHSVIKALETIDDAAVIEIVTELDMELEMDINTILTVVETAMMELLGKVGFRVALTAVLTNLVFNSSEIAEYYLLLKAHNTVENSILKAVKYSFNSYTGKYEQACALNQGVQMMYDSYEYGTDLVLSYAEKVLDDGLLNAVRNRIASIFGKESKNESLKNYAQTWKGIISTGRTCFDTAKRMYEKEDRTNPYEEIAENPPKLVTGISISDTKQSLLLDGDQVYFCRAEVLPLNADNKRVIYSSNDHEVVKVDEMTGRLTPVGPGVAFITAVTDEGGYSARQDIVVHAQEGGSAFTESAGATEWVPEAPVQKDYSVFIEQNESGVTLTGIIEDFCSFNFSGKPVEYRIPEKLNGNTVTEIDLSDVEWDRELKIYLPKTITRIHDRCFTGISRAYVLLNNGVEIIGDHVFDQGYFVCKEFPDTLKEIGARSFQNWNAASLIIPDSLERIGEEAFFYSSIQEIRPEGNQSKLREVGASAFEYSSSLRYVSLPDSVEIIGERAFATGPMWPMKMPKSLQYIGRKAFAGQYVYSTQDDLILPDGIVEIGDGAFSGYTSLNSVSMPDTVKRIGKGAFAGCSNLIEVRCRKMDAIPDSVNAASTVAAEVAAYAFSDCERLKYLELPAVAAAIRENVIENCSSLQTLYWPDTLKILEQQDIMGAYYSGRHTNFADLRIYVKPGIELASSDGGQDGFWEREGLLADEVFWYHIDGREEEIDEKTGDKIRTSWLRYVEIPAAFGKEFRLNAFDCFFKIPEVIVMGPVENVISEGLKNEYSDIAYNRVSCLDEAGNLMLLYQRPDPSPYIKESKAKSENWKDYASSIEKNLPTITEQTILERTIHVTGDSTTIEGIANRPLTIFGWEEENTKNRIHELGEFAEFEDIYLRQKWSYYFRIGLNSGDRYEFSVPGTYQIVFGVPSGWDEEKTAVYHIGTDGLITRLSGEYQKDSSGVTFTALSGDIGSFAVVHLDTMSERVESSWLEELHVKYEAAEEAENTSESTETEHKGTSEGRYELADTTVMIEVGERDETNGKSENEPMPEIRVPSAEHIVVEELIRQLVLKGKKDGENDHAPDILEIVTYGEEEKIHITEVEAKTKLTPQVYQYKEEKGEITFEKIKVKKDDVPGTYTVTFEESGQYYLMLEMESDEGTGEVLGYFVPALIVAAILILILIVGVMNMRKRK